MAYLVGKLSITSARASLPLTGAWWADVTLSPAQGTTGAALSGGQTIELDGLTLTGTVIRSAVVDGVITSRIVGGAGGLGTVLPERFYRGGATVRRIAEDILRECGETLASYSATSLLATLAPTWQRSREPAGIALSRLLGPLGGSWRVTPAGEVLVVASESWPVVAPQHTLVPGSAGEQGVYVVAWPGQVPDDLLPGTTFRGARIRYVVHELTESGLRTEVRTEEPRALVERLRAVLAREAWYSRLHPAVVERQNADGTLDVVVAGKWGETGVRVRHGLPGVTVEVDQGQQILLGYEGHDPAQPFAACWTASGTAKIGTLLVAQNAATSALLAPQWFSAGAVGDAAATAALAAVVGAGNVGFLLPITTPIVEVT